MISGVGDAYGSKENLLEHRVLIPLFDGFQAKISGVMAKPQLAHLKIAKRALRYLKGTMRWGLAYNKSVQDHLVAYSDVNFAKDRDDGRCVTGFVALKAGGVVSWFARRQSKVTKSTYDAAYQALPAGSSEICWMRNLMYEMGLKTQTVTRNVDSKASTCWAQDACT